MPNSGKDYTRQAGRLPQRGRANCGGRSRIIGVMLESNLVAWSAKAGSGTGAGLRPKHHGWMHWLGRNAHAARRAGPGGPYGTSDRCTARCCGEIGKGRLCHDSPNHDLRNPWRGCIEELRKLPGVGNKSAQRLAFHILRSDDQDAEALSTAIREVKERLRLCSICNNITDVDPCLYCSTRRATSAWCAWWRSQTEHCHHRKDTFLERRLSRAAWNVIAAAWCGTGASADGQSDRARRPGGARRGDPCDVANG